MQILNEQAQLFMVAAACMAVGFGLLYLALGLYGMCVDRALRWFGVHAALTEYIWKNRKAWWAGVLLWVERNIYNRRF